MLLTWPRLGSFLPRGYVRIQQHRAYSNGTHLVITRPPEPLNLENVETINHEALGPRQEKTTFSQRLKLLMKTADARLEKSQARYKRYFDKRVRQFNARLEPSSSEKQLPNPKNGTEQPEALLSYITSCDRKQLAHTQWSLLPLQPLQLCETDWQTKSQKTGWYVHPTHPPRQ